jgi:hypothetical protein
MCPPILRAIEVLPDLASLASSNATTETVSDDVRRLSHARECRSQTGDRQSTKTAASEEACSGLLQSALRHVFWLATRFLALDPMWIGDNHGKPMSADHPLCKPRGLQALWPRLSRVLACIVIGTIIGQPSSGSKSKLDDASKPVRFELHFYVALRLARYRRIDKAPTEAPPRRRLQRAADVFLPDYTDDIVNDRPCQIDRSVRPV